MDEVLIKVGFHKWSWSGRWTQTKYTKLQQWLTRSREEHEEHKEGNDGNHKERHKRNTQTNKNKSHMF